MLMLPLDSYYQDTYPVRAANIRHIPDGFGPLLEKVLAKVDSQIGDAPDELWMSIEQSIIFVFKRLKLMHWKHRQLVIKILMHWKHRQYELATLEVNKI